MAIVINGSGTLSGLAVGGLPDGTVDAGTLATDSVTAAKLEVSAITGADLPTGSVLQVVQATNSSVLTISSTSYTATGLSGSITPQFSSSKILVVTNMSAETYQNGSAGIKVYFQVLRGSTSIIERVNDSYAGVGSGGYYSFSPNADFSYLDSPSTTSAVTYSVKTKSSATTNSFSVRLHDQGGVSTVSPSTITLMEIAG